MISTISLVVFVICLFAIAAMMYRYTTAMKQNDDGIDFDRRTMRRACDEATAALNTQNDALALKKLASAISKLETVIDRYGVATDATFQMPVSELITSLEQNMREVEHRIGLVNPTMQIIEADRGRGAKPSPPSDLPNADADDDHADDAISSSSSDTV
jgi:uncharacterized protein (UPF0147 family)